MYADSSGAGDPEPKLPDAGGTAAADEDRHRDRDKRKKVTLMF